MTTDRFRTPSEIPTFDALRTQRRMVLVDIENAAGNGRVKPNQTKKLRSLLTNTIQLTPFDQVVIGCSHINLIEVMTGWPRARVVVRSGPDGADKALLMVLDESITERFNGLVVVSGDHIFSDALSDLPLEIEVVSSRASLARSMRLVADRVTYLPDRLSDAA